MSKLLLGAIEWAKNFPSRILEMEYRVRKVFCSEFIAKSGTGSEQSDCLKELANHHMKVGVLTHHHKAIIIEILMTEFTNNV